MINRIKHMLKDRFETRDQNLLLAMCKEKDIPTDIHQIPVPCPNPWHDHKLNVIEIQNPVNEPNIFINVQTHWKGRRTILQRVDAENYQDFMDMYGGESIDIAIVLSTSRDELRHLYKSLVEYVLLNWILSKSDEA